MSATLALPRGRPYPWPYDGSADPSTTALVVVAPQAGGSLGKGAAAVVAAIDRLERLASRWGAMLIRTRHARPPGQRRPSPLPVAGSPAWHLVAPERDGIVVDAYGIDAFSSSPLEQILVYAGIDHLLVCGFGLEGPVHSTLRSANDRGFECVLIAGACLPVDPSLSAAALSSIEMSGGIFGAVADIEEVESALRSGPGS